MSSTYQRMILGNVSSIFNAAVDDELVTKNPCRAGSVRTPRLDPRRVVPWPVERVGSVRDALADRYRVVATLAAGLARPPAGRGVRPCRRGCRLPARDRQGAASGAAVLDRRSGVPAAQGQEGSDHPAAELGAGRARGPPCVVPRSARLPAVGHDRGRAGHGRAARHVPDGNALQRNNFNRAVWAPALRAARVESSRDNGMHALRHFFASMLLDAGESIKAVSDYLGHSDAGPPCGRTRT